MEIVVETQHPEAAALKPLAESRVLDVTVRVAGWVERVVVRLHCLRGARDGLDKLCQIHVATVRGGLVVASSKGANWQAALDMAMGRAAYALTPLTRGLQGIPRRLA